jgi:hypothetical protein
MHSGGPYSAPPGKNSWNLYCARNQGSNEMVYILGQKNRASMPSLSSGIRHEPAMPRFVVAEDLASARRRTARSDIRNDHGATRFLRQIPSPSATGVTTGAAP